MLELEPWDSYVLLEEAADNGQLERIQHGEDTAYREHERP